MTTQKEKQLTRITIAPLYTESIPKVIVELQEILNRAAQDGIQDLTLEIADSGDGYYDGSPTIYIFGKKLETDQQFQLRIEKEEKYRLQWEEAERCKYEELKKKYG